MAVVKILRSTTPGAVPATLETGQIAFNEADGILFWRDAATGLVAARDFANPTANTRTLGDSSEHVATTEFVQQAISAVINGAPVALNTLKELSDALGGDANFSTTVNNMIANRLRYDAAQSLTPAQKTQVATNLGLATVATSGAYNDLTGKPTLGSVASENVATAAQFRAATASKAVDTSSVSGAAAIVDLGTTGGNITPDFTAFINTTVILNTASTLKFPTVSVASLIGQWRSLEVVEDAIGGRTLAFDVPGTSGYIFDSGAAPAIDTAAGRSSRLTFFIKSTTRIELYMPGKGMR